jgi:hypothetical protein
VNPEIRLLRALDYCRQMDLLGADPHGALKAPPKMRTSTATGLRCCGCGNSSLLDVRGKRSLG